LSKRFSGLDERRGLPLVKKVAGIRMPSVANWPQADRR
jgi:hypothetical protein